MTGLEFVLAVVFAAIWLVPLALALVWERRNQRLSRHVGRDHRDRAP